jgi:hypothetical protein
MPVVSRRVTLLPGSVGPNFRIADQSSNEKSVWRSNERPAPGAGRIARGQNRVIPEALR